MPVMPSLIVRLFCTYTYNIRRIYIIYIYFFYFILYFLHVLYLFIDMGILYIYFSLYIYIYTSCSEKREPEVKRQSKIFEEVFQWGVAQPTTSSKRRTWFLTMPPSQPVRRAAIGRKQCSCYMRFKKRGDQRKKVRVVGEMLQRWLDTSAL